MVAPVAKGPVLERSDLEDLVVQRAEGLLLEVDDGHDEVATLQLREGHGSLEPCLHGGPVLLVLGPDARHDALGLLLVLVVVEAHGVELGAQADLLVDSAGQVLHAEAAQLAGPLGGDAALLGSEVGEDGVDGAGLADEVLGEVEKAGPSPRLLVDSGEGVERVLVREDPVVGGVGVCEGDLGRGEDRLDALAVVSEHLQPAEAQNAPACLHQGLLEHSIADAVHDAEELLVSEDDVKVLHAAPVHSFHELPHLGVELGVLEALDVLDQLAVDGVHDQLQHLRLHRSALSLHLQPLGVDLAHPIGQEGPALEVDDLVHSLDPGAHHFDHELQELLVHALLAMDSEEGHQLLGLAGLEPVLLQELLGVRRQELGGVHPAGRRPVEVVVHVAREAVVHHVEVALGLLVALVVDHLQPALDLLDALVLLFWQLEPLARTHRQRHGHDERIHAGDVHIQNVALGLVLAPLAGPQLGGVGLRVALEGAGEPAHDGAAHCLVDGLVGDEPCRRLVEAEATLEHGLVGGAGQGHILQRVQAELLEEGCAEGLHDVGEAEVHVQVAVVHLPELAPAHHLCGLRKHLHVLGLHLLELGVVLLGRPHGRLAPHLGAGHVLEGHGQLAQQQLPGPALVVPLGAVVLLRGEVGAQARLALGREGFWAELGVRLGDEGEDGRDIARRGLGQIVHELLQAGVVEVRGVSEDQVAEGELEELLAGLEQHLEAQLLEVHLLAHPLLEAHLGHTAVLFVLALVLELIHGLTLILVIVLGLGLVAQAGDGAEQELEVVATTIVEENGHLARLADHAVALEADAGDVVAGAVAVVHHLALLLAAFHELVLAHLAALAGLVLSPLLLGGVRGHIHGLPPVVVAPGHSEHPAEVPLHDVVLAVLRLGSGQVDKLLGRHHEAVAPHGAEGGRGHALLHAGSVRGDGLGGRGVAVDDQGHELLGVAGLVADQVLLGLGVGIWHPQHGLATAGVVAAGLLPVQLPVLGEGLGGLEVATAPGADVDVARQRSGAVHGRAPAAAEGVEVVDEQVVTAQAQQVDLVLRRRGLVEPGLAHQVPLEVAGALPLLLAPIPYEDVDLAGVGPLEGVDVCPGDSALGGVGQGAPVVAEGAELALLLFGILPSPRGKVGLEEDLVGEPVRMLAALARQFVPLRQVRADAPLEAGVVLGARVPEALLLDQLLGQRMGMRAKDAHGPVLAHGRRRRQLVHRRAGAHEEVDVLDAADELARVAEPGRLQVLVQLEARPLHDLGHALVGIRVRVRVPRRRLDEVMVGAGAVVASMLEAIAEGILSIAKGVLGLHDLQVELDLHEEAQLHAEVLVQVTAKRKEGVHHEHLPHRRIQGVLAQPHRLVAVAEGLPHRHARHCSQHDGCHD